MKIQYARDDEGPHSCINQSKNVDKDLYCSSNEFPNHLALLTMLGLHHIIAIPPHFYLTHIVNTLYVYITNEINKQHPLPDQSVYEVFTCRLCFKAERAFLGNRCANGNPIQLLA